MSGTLRVALGEGPLRIEHERLVRDALTRGAPIERDPATKVGDGCDPRVIATAITTWRLRMVHEHLSAAVFSRLLPQLIEAEATLDVKTCVMRMAMDELHHSALCAEVVRGLGGEPAASAELATDPLPEHAGATPRERALRNVMFVGCLSETVALALLTEQHELTTDPFAKRVVAQLMADEMTHAKLGWSYLADVWPTLDAKERERTAAYLPVAFGYLERRMLDTMRGTPSPAAIDDELRSLGVTPSHEAREVFVATVTDAILPRFEELGLTARHAWAARR